MTDPQETDSIAAIDAGNPLLLPLLTRPLNLTPAAAFEALDAPDLRALCRILGISLPRNAEKSVILRHIFQRRQQRIDRQLELDVRAAADIEQAAAEAAAEDAARAADLLREHEMARAALMDDASVVAAINEAPVDNVADVRFLLTPQVLRRTSTVKPSLFIALLGHQLPRGPIVLPILRSPR
jgi:hypothetical protein